MPWTPRAGRWKLGKGKGELDGGGTGGERAGRGPGPGLTCVLGEAGTVAVTLRDGDTMLGPHGAPVRGEGAGGCGGLALGESPLARVPVPGAVG